MSQPEPDVEQLSVPADHAEPQLTEAATSTSTSVKQRRSLFGRRETPSSGRSAEERSIPSLTLPEELQFLLTPECHPDLEDPSVRRIGHMRQAASIHAASSMQQASGMQGHSRRCSMFRQIVGCIVLSVPVQFVMVLVILGDVTITVLDMTTDIFVQEEDHVVTIIADYCVVILLTLDVMGRWFCAGRVFLLSKLNLMELILVPITIVEVFILKDLEVPLPILRALRPVLRSIRVIRILVRTAGKGSSYIAYLRKQVSGERIRFTQDGFDLDLAYVSGQIIAMSLPGAGNERLFHNPYTDVARFLNERHGNKYLLLNTMEERRYPIKPFFGRYFQFPMPFQGVPALEALWHLCKVLDCFLKVDPDHIVAVHSHHGQGRVSMVVIALMLYRGTCPNVTSSIAHVEHNRTNPNSDSENSTQTLDNASQRRFMEYFAQMCLKRAEVEAKGPDNVRRAKLRKIQVHGLPNSHRLDVKCFGHRQIEAGQLREGKTGATEVDAEDLTNAPAAREGLVERVTKLIAEGTLDSVQGGCAPLNGRPLWSSDEVSSVAATSSLKRSQSTFSTFLQPAVWEFPEDFVLYGGFRLEFHRQAVTRSKLFAQDKTAFRGVVCGCFSRRCFCRKWRRASVDKKQATVHSGMLFACWLHSSFLEYDEPADGTVQKHLVLIDLERFSLDKAANAPILRSYSTVLKLQLEFAVDERVEMAIAEEDDQGGSHYLPVYASANISESYTLEWLTWVSKRVWPSFTTGFERLIRNNLLPSLKESMPGPLKNVRLAQCSFGSSYPHFGPINACSRTMDGLEVQLDIQLNYSTAVNIVLDTPIVSFGISHLKIGGVLSLRFKPILEELPVFSAMQLLFLNLPEVDLRFARHLDIANYSWVRSLIFGVINKALCDLLVLPNIININWANPSDDSSVTFRNVLPCSILRLRVIEAKDLHVESSMFKKAPDTFIKAQLGAQVTQTPVVAKNSFPVWGCEFDFLVYDEQQFLSATAMDVDYSGRTHVIGSVNRLSVLSLASYGYDGQWYTLKDAGVDGKRARGGGDVLLAASMFSLEPDAETLARYISPSNCNPQFAGLSSSQNEDLAERESDLEDPEEPEEAEEAEELDEPAGTTDNDLDAKMAQTDVHSSSLALLVCEVFGGHCPADLAAASSVDVKVTLGKAEDKHRCVDAQKVDPGAVSEKNRRALGRLAAMGLDANAIAESLGEDVADVQRIMRKHGWNVELPQKLSLLVGESDLSGATHVEISAFLKKKCLATASVPLSRILQAPGLRLAEVLTCRSHRSNHRIELDVEFRMFVLKPLSVPT